jgi:Nickel responsive protein SCO4226-like
MAVYLVDRDLPGITLDGLVAMQQAVMAICQDFTATGTPVRYLHGLFVPGEARCLCLFEANDEAAVVAVNERAQLPFTRIVEALDLPSELATSTGAE